MHKFSFGYSMLKTNSTVNIWWNGRKYRVLLIAAVFNKSSSLCFQHLPTERTRIQKYSVGILQSNYFSFKRVNRLFWIWFVCFKMRIVQLTVLSFISTRISCVYNNESPNSSFARKTKSPPTVFSQVFFKFPLGGVFDGNWIIENSVSYS